MNLPLRRSATPGAAPPDAVPRWLCLVERVLGGWAPTLRAAVLILVIGACLLAVAAVVFGVPGIAGSLLGFTVVRVLVPHRVAKTRPSF